MDKISELSMTHYPVSTSMIGTERCNRRSQDYDAPSVNLLTGSLPDLTALRQWWTGMLAWQNAGLVMDHETIPQLFLESRQVSV